MATAGTYPFALRPVSLLTLRSRHWEPSQVHHSGLLCPSRPLCLLSLPAYSRTSSSLLRLS